MTPPASWKVVPAAAARIDPTALRGRDGLLYAAHPDLLVAAHVALTLGRPLLLTGEPGCGKTDFAFALARAIDPVGVPIEAYVRSDARAADLLYEYDALHRFADAHHGDEAGKKRAVDARNYLRLVGLGEALADPRRRVVLVDEIDKAPRDLPNDLLRELDQGRFTIKEIPVGAGEHASGLLREMGRAKEDPSRPVVVITSNVERQLPDAFLRRCVFCHLPFPDRKSLAAILRARVKDGEPPLLDRLVDVFVTLRQVPLTKKPGTAELIDWVSSAMALFDPGALDEVLERFMSTNTARADKARLGWRDLPALSCLIKLREDLERLGAV